MTNIFLTDSDEEVIVDFVKEHEELYNKTSEHFKDKTKKEFLWEQFTKSRKLSVKVCKTWVSLAKDMLQEADAVKVWKALKEMTGGQNWKQGK